MAGKLRNISSLSRGILYGWMAGTTIGLIIAPRPGEDSREMIREKGDQVKERTLETLMSARQQAEDMARKGTHQASSLTEQGKTLLNQQKINVQSVVVGIKEGVRAYSQPNDDMQMSSQPTFGNTDFES